MHFSANSACVLSKPQRSQVQLKSNRCCTQQTVNVLYHNALATLAGYFLATKSALSLLRDVFDSVVSVIEPQLTKNTLVLCNASGSFTNERLWVVGILLLLLLVVVVVVLSLSVLLVHGCWCTLSLSRSEESQMRNSHESTRERSIVEFSFQQSFESCYAWQVGYCSKLFQTAGAARQNLVRWKRVSIACRVTSNDVVRVSSIVTPSAYRWRCEDSISKLNSRSKLKKVLFLAVTTDCHPCWLKHLARGKTRTTTTYWCVLKCDG